MIVVLTLQNIIGFVFIGILIVFGLVLWVLTIIGKIKNIMKRKIK